MAKAKVVDVVADTKEKVMKVRKPKQKNLNILKRLDAYTVLSAYGEDGFLDISINGKYVFSGWGASATEKKASLKHLDELIGYLTTARDWIESVEVNEEE